MSSTIPIAAGTVATVVFAASALPMLSKAARTKDLASYSRSSLVMGNVGNLFYSIYVFNLPPGPIWLLHGFYLTSTALMLLWSLRYATSRRAAEAAASTPLHAPLQGSQPCTPSTSRPWSSAPARPASPRATT